MATPATPPVGSSATSSLSDWAGGYVTDMLGKAQAVANEPYQVYQGPMTAGQSNLQSKVFQGLGGLNFPSNLGQSFSSGMGGQQPQYGGTSAAGGLPPGAMGMRRQDPADAAFLQQFMQQGPSVGGVANAVNAPASSLVQKNDPFYQSPEYKQFESESKGQIGTMDMYDSPNFGMVGSGTTGRAMDSAYDKYKAGMPPAGGTLGTAQTGEDTSPAMPYDTTGVKPPPGMGFMGPTGTPPQGGIAGLTPPQASQQPSNIAQSYMNPYLQSVLNPQMDELRRQNEITNMQANAKLTGAGAFGGGRQAIMNAENNRNLMQEQNKTVGQGYANAYDKAMQQFNTEQGQAKTLAEMMAEQGQQERNIDQQGISADYNEFLAQRDDPMKKTQYLQSMLQGLPISTVSNQAAQMSGLGSLNATIGGLGNLSEGLKNLNIKF